MKQLSSNIGLKPVEHPPMASLRPGAVLVADDHSLYRAGFSLLLKDRLGFRAIIEAATFDAALDRLAETPNVELALFDLAMPGISGPESLSVVKDTYPGLRVAIVSGSEERNYVLKAVATGLNGYVPKSLGHYIKNTGNNDLVFLEIFRSDRFEDVSLSDWLAHTPRAMVAQTLNMDPAVVARFPANKPEIMPE